MANLLDQLARGAEVQQSRRSEGFALEACGHSHDRPRSASASLARVRLTMSVSSPPGRRMRYMPGQRASGTIRQSRFLGDPRPSSLPAQGIDVTAEFSTCPTLDKGLRPSTLFGAFCP